MDVYIHIHMDVYIYINKIGKINKPTKYMYLCVICNTVYTNT